MLTWLEKFNQLFVCLNDQSFGLNPSDIIVEINYDLLDKEQILISCSASELNAKLIEDSLDLNFFEITSLSKTKLLAHFNCPKQALSTLDPVSLVQKLAKFTEYFSLKIEVVLNEKKQLLTNSSIPLWTKDSSEALPQEYKDFFNQHYQSNYSDEVPPWLYVKTYEPMSVEGIIFFKKFNPFKVIGSDRAIDILVQKASIDCGLLTSLLPDFFSNTLGVLELKDLSYNQRHTLEDTEVLKELTKEITLNVAASIRRLERKNRADYERSWPFLSHFVKRACMENTSFDQMMRPHILYKSLDGTYNTIAELLAGKDRKSPQKIYYYDKSCINPAVLDQAKNLNIPCVEIDNYLDPLFIQFEESTALLGHYSIVFSSVEMAIAEQSQKKEALQVKEIKNIFEDHFKKRESQLSFSGALNLEVKALTVDSPKFFLCIDESSRRAFYNTRFTVGIESWPLDITVVVNSEHPKIKNLVDLSEHQRAEQIEYFYTQASRHIWPQVPIPGRGC